MSNYDDGLADELDEARGRAAAEAEAARVAALEARLAAVTEAARALVDKRERCDGPDDEHPCARPSMRRRRFGTAFVFCDEHAPIGAVDLDDAAEVRALVALLGEKQ